MTNIIKNCKGGKKRGVGSAEHEIYESIEHRLKSKIGKIFVNEETLENILLRFTKLILILVSIIKKNYKLIKMVNNIYCLELIFFLLNTV